jgi:hypothetical protein
MLRPNQALPEGIPLGQADGMSVATKFMARIGQYKIERTSVNSFRWLHYDSYQRRSLLVRRLFGGAPVR